MMHFPKVAGKLCIGFPRFGNDCPGAGVEQTRPRQIINPNSGPDLHRIYQSVVSNPSKLLKNIAIVVECSFQFSH